MLSRVVGLVLLGGFSVIFPSIGFFADWVCPPGAGRAQRR